MKKGLNDLVPADELHWDSELGSYQILSREQTNELIETCLLSGMDRAEDISRVVKEYEMVRGGTLLFDQFLSGKVRICGFDKSGSPVFKPKDFEPATDVVIECRPAAFKENGSSCELVGDVLVTSNQDCGIKLYRGVMAFCEKWDIDILRGENPDLSELAFENTSYMSDLKRRGWSVTGIAVGEDSTAITVSLAGPWFRTTF